MMHLFQVEIGKDQKPTGDALAAIGVSLLTISSSLAGDVGPPSGRLANRVGQAASGQGALKPGFPNLFAVKFRNSWQAAQKQFITKLIVQGLLMLLEACLGG